MVALLEKEQLIAQLNSKTDYQHPLDVTSFAGSKDQLPAGYTQKRSKKGQATKKIFPPGVSVTLAPLINQLLQTNNLTPQNLDLITLAIGPGMFTGLRVGVVTAKSIAYATNAKLIAINTLEGIATQTFESNFGSKHHDQTIHVAINAQRKQLFVRSFRYVAPWQVAPMGDSELVDLPAWLSARNENDIVVGNGLKLLGDHLSEQQNRLSIPDKSLWELSAESVGKIAWEKFQQGHEDDLWKVQPLYFRPSAAEEKLSIKK